MGSDCFSSRSLHTCYNNEHKGQVGKTSFSNSYINLLLIVVVCIATVFSIKRIHVHLFEYVNADSVIHSRNMKTQQFNSWP